MALLAFILYLEIANSNFPLLFSSTFPRLKIGNSDLLFLRFSVSARKLSLTGSIRKFEKLNFLPKLRISCSSRSNFQILPNGTFRKVAQDLKNLLILPAREPATAALSWNF